MSTFAADNWMTILSRLNSLLLKSDELKEDLGPEALSTHWCGQSPAPESEVLRTEKRLGITLPPSYRLFLSISNGWRPFSSFIERLLPVQEIERFQAADPKKLVMLQKYYQEDELSDDEYLDYETSKHMVALRHRYYPDSILVGEAWGGRDDMILLNPQIVSPDGEWEAIFFANWIPGNRRYRSFLDLVTESVNRSEESGSP